MSGKRLVSSVQITLAPPWRAELSRKNQTPVQNQENERRRSDSPPEGVPSLRPYHNDTWPDHEDLYNGDLPAFPAMYQDEIPTTEDGLGPDLPPPPPPPPILPLSPTRVSLVPSPAPIPDSLSLELQKLELTRTAPSKKLLTSPSSKPMKPLSVPQQEREEAAPGKQSVNGYRGKQESSDICAFCHKTIPPNSATIEAMKKQYHASCFTCRKCHRLLAGLMYYQKDGKPICDHCYKDTLEKCAKCQTLILQHIVRALGNGYHPECFTCVVCNRTIADESFAVDEYNDVYCAEDYYRKYAPICTSCQEPIIPKKEGQDSYKIECLGLSYHESCYRCEKCHVLLSLEPTDSGCFPRKGHLLCKSCHLSWKTEVL